jgi:hypothetical protein
MVKVNIPEDVWKKINKKSSSECWEWMGCKSGDGYGAIQINKRTYSVHRLVYELTYDKIPTGLCVCHTCDNPLCCNPKHLWVGTTQENLKDRDLKNRQSYSYGELCGTHKLITQEVLEIRRLFETNQYTQKELGSKYNVSQSLISGIILKKKWVHI